MTRTFIVGLALLATIAAAHAFGFGLGNRFGKMGSLGAGNGGSPPPACSNRLDFSQACNSQYLTVLH